MDVLGHAGTIAAHIHARGVPVVRVQVKRGRWVKTAGIGTPARSLPPPLNPPPTLSQRSSLQNKGEQTRRVLLHQMLLRTRPPPTSDIHTPNTPPYPSTKAALTWR